MRFTHDSPKTVPEMLDDAVGLYRGNAKLLLAAGGLLLFPAGLLLALGQTAYQAAMVGVAEAQAQGQASSLEALATVSLAIMLLVGLMGMYTLATVLARGVLITAAARLHAGQESTVKDLYRHLRRHLLAYVVTQFLVSMAVSLSALFFLVPAIILGVFWSFTGQVVLIEERSLFDAMGRSFQLVRGTWLRVAGALLAMGLLGWVLQTIVTMPSQVYTLLSLLSNPEAIFQPGGTVVLSGLQGLLNAVAGVVVVPLTTLFTTGLFIDLRVRREGEDLEAALDVAA